MRQAAAAGGKRLNRGSIAALMHGKGGCGDEQMLRSSMLISLLLWTAPALSQPTPASAPVSPRSVELFERDWVLMNWALKMHDGNRDIFLSPNEALTAAAAFREIADGNGDGRVTPQEYRAAREFIIARY